MTDRHEPPPRKVGLGNRIAPPRFILFVVVLVAVDVLMARAIDPARAFMIGFDVAASVFLASLAPMLRAKDQNTMRAHAAENDANRVLLLAIAVVVSVAILIAVAVELGEPQRANKPLVVVTLFLTWLFANTVYALHYAHVYYLQGSEGGLDFSGDPDAPDYWDFIYFAFTLGMTFQTSDTAVVTRKMRMIVTGHSLAAFVFNIGIVAFSINVLGSGGK